MKRFFKWKKYLQVKYVEKNIRLLTLSEVLKSIKYFFKVDPWDDQLDTFVAIVVNEKIKGAAYNMIDIYVSTNLPNFQDWHAVFENAINIRVITIEGYIRFDSPLIKEYNPLIERIKLWFGF